MVFIPPVVTLGPCFAPATEVTHPGVGADGDSDDVAGHVGLYSYRPASSATDAHDSEMSFNSDTNS